jgi:hypothetical protein
LGANDNQASGAFLVLCIVHWQLCRRKGFIESEQTLEGGRKEKRRMAATLPGQTSQLGEHNSDGIFAGHSALDDILSVGHAPVRAGMPPAGHSPMHAGNISSNGSSEPNAGPPSSVESNASGMYHMGSILGVSVQSDLQVPANSRVGTITNGDTIQRQNTLGGKRNSVGPRSSSAQRLLSNLPYHFPPFPPPREQELGRIGKPGPRTLTIYRERKKRRKRDR